MIERDFKFKKGDRVVCVTPYEIFGVKKGFIGTVSEEYSNCPYVDWDGHKTIALRQEKMELIKETKGEEEMQNKTTKEEFDAMYVGAKLVVHCKTEELANEFLALADEFGYKWSSGTKYVKDNNYDSYGKETCYRISDGTFADKECFENKSYTVKSFIGTKQLYKITDNGQQFTSYTDFFFKTKNQKFASQYDYGVLLPEGTIVEIVGNGKHERSEYPEIIIVFDPKTNKVYLIQMGGLEKVETKQPLPKGVKSIDVNDTVTKVTLDDGRVGYAKCSGVDKMDILVGFSVAYAKASTNMSAEELRKCLPVVEKEEPKVELELFYGQTNTSCGNVGDITRLLDCDGRQLYVGDVVSVSRKGEAIENSIIARDGYDGNDFVMGIKRSRVSGSGQISDWKIKFLKSYKELTDGCDPTPRGIKVRVKK